MHFHMKDQLFIKLMGTISSICSMEKTKSVSLNFLLAHKYPLLKEIHFV